MEYYQIFDSYCLSSHLFFVFFLLVFFLISQRSTVSSVLLEYSLIFHSQHVHEQVLFLSEWVFFRVSPQHLSAGAGCCGGHQQQQRVRLRLPRQRSQRQPFHLQAQRQVLQREGCQGDQIALPQVG